MVKLHKVQLEKELVGALIKLVMMLVIKLLRRLTPSNQGVKRKYPLDDLTVRMRICTSSLIFSIVIISQNYSFI